MSRLKPVHRGRGEYRVDNR